MMITAAYILAAVLTSSLATPIPLSRSGHDVAKRADVGRISIPLNALDPSKAVPATDDTFAPVPVFINHAGTGPSGSVDAPSSTHVPVASKREDGSGPLVLVPLADIDLIPQHLIGIPQPDPTAADPATPSPPPNSSLDQGPATKRDQPATIPSIPLDGIDFIPPLSVSNSEPEPPVAEPASTGQAFPPLGISFRPPSDTGKPLAALPENVLSSA